MKPIEIWAPAAQTVEILARGERKRLDPIGGNRFRLPELLPPGTEYSLSLDGGPPLPDPRSDEQPSGVHGPSRVVDHDFAWTDRGFRAPPLSSAVLYELHVGTFSTDQGFEGVIPRLPHLVELGVTHIELMPIVEFPGARGWGYDGVDLFAPHHAYGGAHGLKTLVNACHAHGIAVLLDVVYNHLGPDGNYLPRFGPYLTDAHHTPWGSAVNLDAADSHEVRRFLIDNARHWFEHYHVDGLRLDAVHALYDQSATHFLEQLSAEIAELSTELAKPLVLIAESDRNDPRLVRAPEAGGFGLDAQWSDDFHHALHAVLTGERHSYYADFGSLEQLAHALQHGFVFEGQYSAFRKHRHGHPLGDVPLQRLIGFLQNHDQVGNRAAGDRIGHLLTSDRLALGVAVVLLGPFIPLLFQGEEWNASTGFSYFTDHGDPGLARAVSEGRRREFAELAAGSEVPDPQALSTFRASQLDFSELERPEHRQVFELYRSLIALRKTRPELQSPALRVRSDPAGWLLLARPNSLVAVNFGLQAATLPAFTDGVNTASALYATRGATLLGDHVFLPAESLIVLVR